MFALPVREFETKGIMLLKQKQSGSQQCIVQGKEKETSLCWHFSHCVKFILFSFWKEKNLRIHPGLKRNLKVYREVKRKPDQNPVNRLTSHQKANVYRCNGQITSGRPEANKCLPEKCQKVGCYFSTFRANHVTPQLIICKSTQTTQKPHLKKRHGLCLLHLKKKNDIVW